MMKKLLYFFLLLGIQFNSNAYDFVSGGIFYNISGSNVTVTYETSSYNSYSGDVVIPEFVYHNSTKYTVTQIDARCFQGCSNLNSVILPKTITYISANAFRSSSISSIVIPNSVATFFGYAFYGCTNLKSVTISEGGNNKEAMGAQWFNGCTSLKSVYLPSTLSGVGFSFSPGFIFYNCTSLDSIFINLSTPPTITAESSFTNVPTSTCKLFVPVGAKVAYEAAAYWSNFTNIIETNMSSPTLESTGNISESTGWTGGTKNRFANATVNGGELTIDADALLSTVEVGATGKLKINASKKLSVYSLLLKSTSTDGTATFVNNGTLNISTAEMEQYFASGRTYYLSSPVSNATAGQILKISGAQLGYYDETTNNFNSITDPSTTLTPGKGYLVKFTDNTTLSLSGLFNNGNIEIALTNTTANTSFHGFNLVGNPYPSYLDWEAVSKTNAEVSLWTRSKGTNNSYVFDSYNSTSGIGTNNSGHGALTRYIPPMQGFWVKIPDGQSTGSLSLTNAMRYHRDVSNNRMKVVENQHIVRIKLSRDLYSDEAVILTNTQASNQLDDYDTQKMSNNNPLIPEIAFQVDGKNVCINGIPGNLPYQEIPVNFKTGTAGDFNINIDEMNLPEGVELILKDKATDISHTLQAGSNYTFSSDITDTNTRFSFILKTPGTVTETITPEKIKFNIGSKYLLSDLTGKLIKQGTITSDQDIFEMDNASRPQIYLLNLQSNTGVERLKVWVK